MLQTTMCHPESLPAARRSSRSSGIPQRRDQRGLGRRGRGLRPSLLAAFLPPFLTQHCLPRAHRSGASHLICRRQQRGRCSTDLASHMRYKKRRAQAAVAQLQADVADEARVSRWLAARGPVRAGTSDTSDKMAALLARVRERERQAEEDRRQLWGP